MNVFPHLSDILWSFLSFCVLLWGLNKWLFKPILSMVTQREKEIEGNIAKAEADVKEAERLRKEFADQLANAQREAQETIARATAAASKESERILEEGRAKAADALSRAEDAIRRERDRALAELREEVATLAVAAAGKVIGRALNTDDHKRLVEDFVAEAGKH